MRHPFSLDLDDLEPAQQEETLTEAEAAAVGGGHRFFTRALHEQGGPPEFTTLALGEEGGGGPIRQPIRRPIRPIRPIKRPIATTQALGEEGGGPVGPPMITTLAIGEEGGFH